MTTDIETGEAVVFDTHAGAKTAPEHLLASCGFLPDFPPLEIDAAARRWRARGNPPIEIALHGEPTERELGVSSCASLNERWDAGYRDIEKPFGLVPAGRLLRAR